MGRSIAAPVHASANFLELGPRGNQRLLVEMADPEPRDAGAQQHPRDDQRDDTDGDPEIGFLWCGVGFRHQLGCFLFDLTVCSRRRCREFRKFRLDDEAVTFARNRFDVDRLVARIAARLAKLVHRGVDVGVVIDVRLIGPEAQPQLFAREDIALLLNEREQHLIHLALKAKARAAFGYFLALLINLKRAEPDIPRRELDRPGRSCGRIGFHRRTQV